MLTSVTLFSLAWHTLISIGSDVAHASNTAHPEPGEWQSYLHDLASVQINNQRLPSLLGPMLNHHFSIPKSQLRRGTVYMGSNHRLRRVVRDLITGRRMVKIGVVGGSISWGQGASEVGKTDWFSVFSKYVLAAFPHANVTLRNGCVPGTPSGYMVMCLELSVDEDVDVIFSEYIVNDGFDDAILDNSKVMVYERLVRRVLSLPNRPAMIMMQVPAHGIGQDQGSSEWKPFYHTTEELLGALAQYYDVQWLSMRTALYRLAALQKIPGQRWKDFIGDGFHPADPGFRVMADLAIWLFQQTAIDLMLHPFSKTDQELVNEALPEPMYQGNHEPSSALCLHQDLLKPVVIESAGWEYVNEGTDKKPKKGYVSFTPGSVLKVKIDTFRDGGADLVPVLVAYLKSYHKMGIATMRCESGCTCAAKEVDALHALHESTTYLALLNASQHKECVVSVMVEQKTSGDEHKFKVSGIMISEVVRNSSQRYDIAEGFWGMRQHAGLQNQTIFKREP